MWARVALLGQRTKHSPVVQVLGLPPILTLLAAAALPLFERFGVQIGEPALATKARPLLVTGMCCMVLLIHMANLNPRLLIVARISDVLLLLL